MRPGVRPLFVKSPYVSPVPTARDYVTTDLISMWDGIENAGWGQHEDNPDTFVDLAGNDSIGKYGNSVSSAYPTWFSEDALCARPYLNGQRSSVLYDALVGGNVTVELVATRESLSGSTVGFPQIMSANNWINFAGFIGARLLVYNRGAAQYVDGFPDTAPYSFSTTLSVDGDGVMYVYRNGTYFTTVNPGAASQPSNGNFSIGLNLNLVNNGSYHALLTHCLRVYSRALTSSEIAANNAVDVARFGMT